MDVNNLRNEESKSKVGIQEEIKKIDHQLRETYRSIKFNDSIYESIILKGSDPYQVGQKIEQLHFDEVGECNDSLSFF